MQYANTTTLSLSIACSSVRLSHMYTCTGHC